MKRILAVRADRLGDVTLTLPACVELKRAHPEAELFFMCRDYARPIVTLCEAVDGVVVYEPEGHHFGLGGAIALAKDLKALEFDLAILFYPRPLLALALRLAGIPVRAGTGRRWYSFLLNHRADFSRRDGGRHEAECNLELASPFIGAMPGPGEVRFGLAIPTGEREAAARELISRGVTGAYAVVHPGSGGSAPGLPTDMFARIAVELVETYGLRVLVAGTNAEARLVEEVMALAGAGDAIIPVTGLTLTRYAAVIAGARFFTANSTGPLHVARALEVPVLGFYCSAKALAPDRWGPYNRHLSAMTPEIAACDKCDRGKCEYVNCLELLEWEAVRARVGVIIGGPRIV